MKTEAKGRKDGCSAFELYISVSEAGGGGGGEAEKELHVPWLKISMNDGGERGERIKSDRVLTNFFLLFNSFFLLTMLIFSLYTYTYKKTL